MTFVEHYVEHKSRIFCHIMENVHMMLYFKFSEVIQHWRIPIIFPSALALILSQFQFQLVTKHTETSVI